MYLSPFSPRKGLPLCGAAPRRAGPAADEDGTALAVSLSNSTEGHDHGCSRGWERHAVREDRRKGDLTVEVMVRSACSCPAMHSGRGWSLQYKVVHISVGDLLRAEVAAGTPAGRKAQSFMDSGTLVPNEVMPSKPLCLRPDDYDQLLCVVRSAVGVLS
jgi:hypothetical protein